MPPTGKKLKSGFKTKLSFANAPGAAIWQQRVKPPGVDGGNPIDHSDMENDVWRTMIPAALKSLTPCTLRAHYDPKFLGDLQNQTNKLQLMTLTFPDNATWAFWGWVQKADPDENTETDSPIIVVTICPSNETDAGVETGPVYAAPPTTVATTTTTLP